MATNKVVYGNTTLIDTTGDTADVSDVKSGETFHSRSGAQLTGTMVTSPKNMWYGTCSSAEETEAKVVTTSTGDFVLGHGNMIRVRFNHNNTSYNVTLSVDGTTATYVVYQSSYQSSMFNVSYMWKEGEVVDFVYDSDNNFFVMSNGGPATTTYYGATKLSSSVSLNSNLLAATPSAVKAAYDLASSKQDTLVSGTNIKTINSTSLLGSGNIDVISEDANGDVSITRNITAGGHIEAENLPGIIKMFAGTFAPTGWLLCNGAEVSRTDYAALFDVIGTTYGAGDGSTTFNLPDLRGRVPVGTGIGTASDATSHALGQTSGAETHTLTSGQSGVPAHKHSINHGHGFTNPSSRIYLKKLAASGSATWTPQNQADSTGNYGSSVITSGGSVTNHTGDSGNNTAANATTAHNNMQPYTVVNYIISTGGVSRWADSAGLPIVRDVAINGLSIVNNEIADIPVVDLSNSISVTTTTGNLYAKYAKQWGRVFWLVLIVQNSASVAAGSNIYQGTVTGIPRPIVETTGASYYGNHAICGGFNSAGLFTIRNASSTAVTINGTNTTRCTVCYIA